MYRNCERVFFEIADAASPNTSNSLIIAEAKKRSVSKSWRFLLFANWEMAYLACDSGLKKLDDLFKKQLCRTVTNHM